MNVFFTIDVDMTDYVRGGPVDEFETALPMIVDMLQPHAGLRATWFVRIDGEIEARFGGADHCLTAHRKAWVALREAGHEVAWHYHPPAPPAGAGGLRRLDERAVLEDIARFAPVARRQGMEAARIGYGFQTNATLDALDAHGFRVDSSAIPRPRYPWDTVWRDWEGCPQEPFRPGRADYRAPGPDPRRIVELPISTVPLPCPGDTRPDVMRYVNPAYRHEAFVRCWNGAGDRGSLTLVMHPYEILASSGSHALIAFDPKEFRQNLEFIAARAGGFFRASDAAPTRSAPP